MNYYRNGIIKFTRYNLFFTRSLIEDLRRRDEYAVGDDCEIDYEREIIPI